MTDRTILTPATRLRYDAGKLRQRSFGLSLEAYGILGGGPHYPRRPIYDRIVRSSERLDALAAELEQIADELDAGDTAVVDEARLEVDQVYTFGTRDAVDG